MVWVDGADERGHLGPVAHGDDPAVGDGQRLGGGPGVVDGQDGSVHDDICGGHVPRMLVILGDRGGSRHELQHVLVWPYE